MENPQKSQHIQYYYMTTTMTTTITMGMSQFFFVSSIFGPLILQKKKPIHCS